MRRGSKKRTSRETGPSYNTVTEDLERMDAEASDGDNRDANRVGGARNVGGAARTGSGRAEP